MNDISKEKMSKAYVELYAEYFRPKFEEILNKYHEDSLTTGMIELLLNKLIECLKNPEGK